MSATRLFSDRRIEFRVNKRRRLWYLRNACRVRESCLTTSGEFIAVRSPCMVGSSVRRARFISSEATKRYLHGFDFQTTYPKGKRPRRSQQRAVARRGNLEGQGVKRSENALSSPANKRTGSGTRFAVTQEEPQSCPRDDDSGGRHTYRRRSPSSPSSLRRSSTQPGAPCLYRRA